MLPYESIWFLSISLADCISSGGSRICFLMLANECFQRPNPARRRVWKSRKGAEHGTKHVLHVGALTPQSFRQMAGDIWSVDGYRISKTHSQKTLRPNFHQIACWPVRDPAYMIIHPHSIIQATMMSMIRIFQTEGPWMSRFQVLLCLCPAFGLPNFSADLVLTTCRTWETSGTSRPQNAPQTEPHVRGVANLLDSVFALEPLP